ncbi:MAG: alpha/beta hydrolase [Cyanobacteria bacterium]|nr:alpha/beta hydrolase [Cyanobacteriota bacterium]
MTRHFAILGFVLCAPAAALAQIDTGIIEKHKAALEKQTTDPDQKREGGTQPRDWDYQLPEGVRTRQVTFYVDGGTALYGKLFLPKGFTTTGKLPAVVVGHGINALSIGIEKFAARFAERGLVAMAIDYQSYGFSSSGSDDIRLLEPDTTTDANAVTEKEMRILLKRTNLNNAHEVADFRAAISFLQGEPGVDPDKIGIWGSSNGGSVVIVVAAVDARVKAVVSQVATPRPAPRAPVQMGANLLQDAIKRVREGQGAEVDGGFSFRSKVDQWSTQRNRDVRPGQTLDQIRPTTAVLFLPAEKDELTQGAAGAIEAAKFLSGRGVPSQAIVFPALTHFQAYSNAGFEIGSNLAADWFLKYLNAGSTKVAADAPFLGQGSTGPGPGPAIQSSPQMPPGVTAREVVFFSEGIKAYAKVFLPSGFSSTSNAAAVVVAPGVGQTVRTIEPAAAALAQRGLVAMAIDYRGWGKSGAFIYLSEPVRWDDRLRFSQHTAKVTLRRRRIVPDAQVIDIRNALTFLQGEPGVDATRLGMLGMGLAGAHVVSVAANDARIKAGAAMQPWQDGQGVERRSFAPSAAQQAVMVRLARRGSPPTTDAAGAALNADESKLAFAEYQPFRLVDQIPRDTAMLYLDRADAGAAADFLAKALMPK